MFLDETAEEVNTVAGTEEGFEAETEDKFVDPNFSQFLNICGLGKYICVFLKSFIKTVHKV